MYLFITDTLGDIIESNKVGIKSVGVTWGYHTKENLSKGNPFFIAENFDDLRHFLLKYEK